MLKTDLEQINQILDDNANMSYAFICKKFSSDTADWNSLTDTQFYTTRGSEWTETPDNAHNGIDISWAFHLTDKEIDKRATDELFDIITSELINGDDTTNAIEHLSNKVDSIRLNNMYFSENKSENPSAITKFTIAPLKNPQNNIVAIATATFYDTITVNSITIRKGTNDNLFVMMPQKKTQQGNYIDVVHPLNADTRQEINDTLLKAFKSGNLKKDTSADNSSEQLSVKNPVKYPVGEYGGNIARLDLVVNDIVVHNCKIINGKDNTPFLSMPTYKKDGKFFDIVKPTSSETYRMMNELALAEYDTKYVFRIYDDNQVSALKNSDIAFTLNKNDKGENIVKFKAEDMEKVKAIVYPTTPIQK